MKQIVINTPSWVFALFIGLLLFGLLQTRDRAIKKPFAYLLPVAMIALSFFGVQSAFGVSITPMAAWLTGMLLISIIMRRLFRQSALSFDQQENRFFIPGSWAPLAVIMGIFFTKYALAVVGAVGVSLGLGAALCVGFLLGSFSGYFTARALVLIEAAQEGGDSKAKIKVE